MNTRSAFFWVFTMQSIPAIFLISKRKNGCPFPIRLCLCSHFEPLIIHVTYAIYIINIFHSVNLILNIVTSIQNNQKMDQKYLENRKQDETCLVTLR